MKKIVLFLFCAALVSGAAMAQPPLPRPPAGQPPALPVPPKRDVGNDVKSQASHVKSSGDDLLHLRFKKAHEKHVAEMKKKNRGIAKDLGIKGVLPPPPPKIRKPD